MALRRERTSLEIIVSAVLVAAIAAVLVWGYRRNQTAEFLEVMRDDLRNLAIAQEGYAADNNGAFMPENPGISTDTQYYGYAPSTGVTVSIAPPDTAGWSATATHERAPGRICGIFVAHTPPGPPNPATVAGKPACE